MRIFLVIQKTAHSFLNNETWYRNLYEPLVEMGHNVFFFPAEEGGQALLKGSTRLKNDFSRKLLDTFTRENKKSRFDLFFSYLMDGMVDPSVIDEIRNTKVPTCNFSCNNAHQFHLITDLAPHFDFNLHSEKDVRDKFITIGANPLWWPMASNPRYFKPAKALRNIDVSFVGANYALRARYIKSLLENGIAVHVYGPSWRGGAMSAGRSIAKRCIYLISSALAVTATKQFQFSALLYEHDLQRYLYKRYPGNLHGPVPDEEVVALYSKSFISLGFLEVFDNHDPTKSVIKHLHLREFEAPMCGALYCTGYSDELAEFFEPDKEVIVYKDANELLDKIRYYLSHPAEGEKIRAAGLKRALDDHTYHRRYKQLFQAIGL